MRLLTFFGRRARRFSLSFSFPTSLLPSIAPNISILPLLSFIRFFDHREFQEGFFLISHLATSALLLFTIADLLIRPTIREASICTVRAAANKFDEKSFSWKPLDSSLSAIDVYYNSEANKYRVIAVDSSTDEVCPYVIPPLHLPPYPLPLLQ